jgi:hypothetical protein
MEELSEMVDMYKEGKITKFSMESDTLRRLNEFKKDRIKRFCLFFTS